jgi:hypothetical protein
MTTTAMVAAFVFACTTGADRPPSIGSSTVTSAELGPASNDDAITRIATARCERALACNAIGQGRAYEDQPTCLETIGLELERQIGADECRSGVSRVAAVECVLDIRQARCGQDVENLSTPPERERRKTIDEAIAAERGASQSSIVLQPRSCDRARLCPVLAR